MTTVLLGIGIHFFIILPTIFVAVTRRNPLTYYANMLPGDLATIVAILHQISSPEQP